MNHARASGAPIVATLGGQSRSLRRLSRRDFGTLSERMPVAQPADRLYLTPFDVHRWASTVAGAAAVIALASLPRDHAPAALDERLAEVEAEGGAWGSMVQQCTVASIVTAESVLSGEEPPPAEGDEQRPDPPPPGALAGGTSATMPTRPG